MTSICTTHTIALVIPLSFGTDTETSQKPHNVEALIIRIGCWGPLYYNDNKEPQNGVGSYLGPHITHLGAFGPLEPPPRG